MQTLQTIAALYTQVLKDDMRKQKAGPKWFVLPGRPSNSSKISQSRGVEVIANAYHLSHRLADRMEYVIKLVIESMATMAGKG